MNRIFVHRRATVLAVFPLVFAVAAGAEAGYYQITDLGNLPGGSFSEADGVNDNGQVVGLAYDASGSEHAFLYSGGSMLDLGAPFGATWADAWGIDSSGQVVGYAGSGAAFLYSGGSMTNLNVPGVTSVFGINQNGLVVGTRNTGSSTQAYTYDIGSSTLTTLAAATGNSAGYAVNDQGTVAGAAGSPSVAATYAAAQEATRFRAFCPAARRALPWQSIPSGT